ncbi:MAG: hypothetical protein NPIRA01_09990 [Nitrospirales bacterium]|nr:MAG: hypothetical protein NPIRA01_09990 [Nitrospirales bacterium]
MTGVVFPGKVEFRNVEIPAVSFYQVTFTDHVWFSGSTFTSNATFEAATFIDGARFNETIFNGHAWFKETTFNGDASFEGTTFKRLAWFEETTFNGDASFQAATFIACARFDETIFKGHARFDKTTFTRQASFDETTFNGEAWFEETTFNGDVSFPSSGNTYGGEEVKAKVFPCANFQGAFFGGSVSFVNRRFLQPTVFRHCVFERAPEFHGCTLHQGTVFPPRQNFKDVTSEGAAQAYRTLKLAMEQTRSRQEEAMFFALEQASHRAQKTTPWSIQILSFLYEKAANYGESFLRPLGWLAMTTFIFIILYCVFSYDPTNKIWHLMESVQFAMEQLVRPFSAWLPNGGIAIKAILGNKSSAVLGLQILSTAQALVSLSLITLFILAVRRRFRLG